MGVEYSYLNAGNPLMIKLDIPRPSDERDFAGVNDGGMQVNLVACRGHLTVYDNSGRKLWVSNTDIVVGGPSESQGLPCASQNYVLFLHRGLTKTAL